MSPHVLKTGRVEVELPNGSDGDSLVHVRLPTLGRSLLFDAGDPSRLAARDVLRLDHLFVSHCHVDHFIGFDALLRPRVCREDRLTCHGPPGFLSRVASRLAGYEWNLTDGNHFVLTARELREDAVLSARFDSGRSFVREDLPRQERLPLAFEEGDLEVRSAALDHHVVSQAFSLRWKDRWRVDTEAIASRGLPPGPWLSELKRRLAEGEDERGPLELPDGSRTSLGGARDDLLQLERGERVCYVTDTLFADHTRPRIVELARRADIFACEAPFLNEHREKAEASRHLTAEQAGLLAAEAEVSVLLLFHVSDRYQGDFSRHVAEAQAAAGGDIEVRTVPPPA